MRVVLQLLILFAILTTGYVAATSPELPWVRGLERRFKGWARVDIPVRDSVFAAVESHLQERDSTAQAASLLATEERQTLIRSPYRRHLAAARALGAVDDPATDLVELPREARHFRSPWRQQRLAPEARDVLDTLGRRFADELVRSGLPPARFTITSTYRDADHQARLRKTNRYAARGTSSHEFGASFDISMQRFSFGGLAEDSAAFRLGTAAAGGRWDNYLHRRLLPAVRRWESEALEGLVADQSNRYDAALGRALLRLQGEGQVYALREEGPGCYHVTVR